MGRLSCTFIKVTNVTESVNTLQKKIAYARCSPPSFLAKPKVQSRKFHFRCLRLRRCWWVLVFAVQFCPWWQHRHRSNNSSWVPHPSSPKPEGVKARQLRSGWITGSLRQFRSTRRNKDALPHHYAGKTLLRFFPGTRTYCPAGVKAVVAQSCPIFSQLCGNRWTLSWESVERLCEQFQTGQKFLMILNKIKSSIIPLTRYIVSSLWEK